MWTTLENQELQSIHEGAILELQPEPLCKSHFLVLTAYFKRPKSEREK